MILVRHDAFRDKHTGLAVPANESVIHPNQLAWFLTRLAGAGATGIAHRELSPAEFRARVLAAHPQLAKAAP